MIEPGKIAPDFTLPNQDGEPTKLSAFRGKNVILFFYPKADTLSRRGAQAGLAGRRKGRRDASRLVCEAAW